MTSTAARFVIVCLVRTGSTWLSELLNAHPSILCHGEVFNPRLIGYAIGHGERSTVADAWTLEMRDAEPRAFIDDVFAEAGDHGAVGVKILGWHAPDVLAELLADTGVHKVILRRLNRTHVFLSIRRSETLDQWFGVEYDGMRVRIEPDELLAFADRYDSVYEQVARASAGTPVHHVTYEELLADPLRPNQIVEFLGLEPPDAPLRSSLRRQSRDLIRDAVTNIDELTERLAGTRLEHELGE